MRKKEDEVDYRFMPEPDLPLLFISQQRIDSIKKDLPPHLDQIQEKLLKEYKLSPYEAKVLIEHGASLYFEQVTKNRDPKRSASV